MDCTLFQTCLAPCTSSRTRFQAVTPLLHLQSNSPTIPSTRLRQNPRRVGVEFHSERVRIAEAGQGLRLPRAGFPRRTWRCSMGLYMLITLPTPNVEEMCSFSTCILRGLPPCPHDCDKNPGGLAQNFTHKGKRSQRRVRACGCLARGGPAGHGDAALFSIC